MMSLEEQEEFDVQSLTLRALRAYVAELRARSDHPKAVAHERPLMRRIADEIEGRFLTSFTVG